MQNTKLIRLWSRLEAGRLTRLADLSGFSKQSIDTWLSKGFSENNLNKIFDAMAMLDNLATINILKIESILINCIKLSHSNDAETKKYALSEFKRWSDLYVSINHE